MADQQQVNESISFHSQIKVPLIGMCICIALVCSAAPFLPVIDKSLPPLTSKQQATLPIFGILLSIMVCYLFLSLPGVGNYRIDREGIEQTKILTARRYLGWQDVDRVKWEKDLVCFEGKGISISILWALVSSKDASQAKQFLEKVLSPDFDLSIKAVPRWSYSMVGFYVAGAVLIISVFAMPRAWLFSRSRLAGWLAIACSLFVCFIFFFRRMKKEERKKEQINPTWRLRRKKEHAS